MTTSPETTKPQPSERKPALRRRACVLVLLVIATAVGIDSFGSSHRVALASVSVDDVRPGEVGVVASELVELWLDTPVTLVAGEVAVSVTRRELGGRVEFDRPVADLESQIRFDESAGIGALDRLRQVIDLRPMAAGSLTSPREGQSINMLSALGALERGLSASSAIIELPVTHIAPPEPAPIDVGDATFGTELAGYATEYSTSERLWGRRKNIELSARAVDGAVIEPGRVLSFNELVGERTIERGFRGAREVSGGRVVDGVGGGICQVAATLHAAAFKAGFGIVEHHPHTRGASYIELGLDAAVSWGGKDMKIQNPYRFPVRIRATASKGTVSVALVGAESGRDVAWSTELVRVIARGREVEMGAPGLPGEQTLDRGRNGLVIRRTRVLGVGADARREVVDLVYPPVNTLIRRTP